MIIIIIIISIVIIMMIIIMLITNTLGAPLSWLGKLAAILGEGQMGSALTGALQISLFLTDFLGTPVNLRSSSQKCQGVPLQRPISVGPICPQPTGGWSARKRWLEHAASRAAAPETLVYFTPGH